MNPQIANSKSKDIRYLEERVQYLEELNRFTLDALEMAGSLGDFQANINQLHEPAVILREARSRVERLIKFQAAAFFLVDEDENDWGRGYKQNCCMFSSIVIVLGYIVFISVI